MNTFSVNMRLSGGLVRTMRVNYPRNLLGLAFRG